VSVFLILLALGFVFLNAFFVAAEFAMVKLRHSRVQQLKEKQGMAGRVLFQVHQELEAYLSACQLGITLASLGLGWVGEPAFAHLCEPFFRWAGIHSPETIKVTSFAVAFTLISFLHIVVGELMPKTMAIRQSERLSLYTSIPLYLFYWLMYPFIWILNHTANILLKLFRLDASSDGEKNYSTDEIKFILTSSHIHEKLDQEYKAMLIRMLEFSDVYAVDIMRPIEEMISINNNSSLEEKLAVMKKYRYTRYPVYQDKLSNIIGILHAKDLLLTENTDTVVLRPFVKVSRRTKAVKILQRLREGKPNFGVVYYHHKPIGFITVDNLLHVLIGRMQDEFHLTQEDWQLFPDGSYLIKGIAPVYIIEKLLKIDLSVYPVDTVGGLLLNNLGHLPAEGEVWEHPQFILRTEKLNGHRISQVRLIIK
jgi:CBS domain containing-hemolysin-like protein